MQKMKFMFKRKLAIFKSDENGDYLKEVLERSQNVRREIREEIRQSKKLLG